MPGPVPRVVIEDVRPQVDCGRFPAKAALELPLELSAVLVIDGADRVLAWVRHGPPAAAAVAAGSGLPPGGRGSARGKGAGLSSGWMELPLVAGNDDRWAATIVPTAQGDWSFEIVAMPDAYGTWLRDLRLRFEAGQDVRLELEEGALLADHAAARQRASSANRTALRALATALRAGGEADGAVMAAGRAEAVALMARTADRSQATTAGPFPLWVDRLRGAFSAWYELFPRSEGATAARAGTLRTVVDRLPAIAAMGFDTVYLPPIHPIGVSHRKGRNNALMADADDPGSPWAIGGPDGGHTAVHRDLGTTADLDHLVAAAAAAGLEIALDYALQCSPDHPWVTEHPQWFRHRPDGTIRYAENPPKRYQDIFPINFDTEDRLGLWTALREVLLFWLGHGVRIFRVDNPHTKAIAFWEWLIGGIRSEYPDVIFLAEAFTRPALMRRLAKLGFTQSYTYFTWRNTKYELTQYLTELSSTSMVDYFRPNFWVNSPDILADTLQHGGPGAFRLRLVLAALAAPSWGMYSGYELYENVAVRPGSEEYLDSEKYQVRVRDWGDARSLAPMISVVNGIRRRHRDAVAELRTLRLHHVGNENLLCFSRMTHDGSDVLLVVVNLDPFTAQEGTTWLDMEAIGLTPDTAFWAHDELTDTTYGWQGAANYVRLDPAVQPAHILHLRPR